MWLLGSAGFSYYVTHLSSYDKLYGALAAPVVLMVWFWLSAIVILIGDAELEGLARSGRQDPALK
jgi:membrane protein